VTGFILPDGSEALFGLATVAALEDSMPERVRFEGLDSGDVDRRYARDNRMAVRVAQRARRRSPLASYASASRNQTRQFSGSASTAAL
jgi:hypothetical protein